MKGPSEESSKKPVSVVRAPPQKAYKDPRFNALFGKADLAKTRQDYRFLDEWRESEIAEMKKEIESTQNTRRQKNLERKVQSLESRLQTLRARDFEHTVVKEHLKSNKVSYIKRSDKKKLVLNERFKTLKKKDVDRAVERRRKKNAAKDRKRMFAETDARA